MKTTFDYACTSMRYALLALVLVLCPISAWAQQIAGTSVNQFNCNGHPLNSVWMVSETRDETKQCPPGTTGEVRHTWTAQVEKMCTTAGVRGTGVVKRTDEKFEGKCTPVANAVNINEQDKATPGMVKDVTEGGVAVGAGADSFSHDVFGVCRWVNPLTSDVSTFIPDATSAQWLAYIAAHEGESEHEDGVTLSKCCPAKTVTLTANDGQTYDHALSLGKVDDISSNGVVTVSHDFTRTRAEDGATWTETVSQTYTCTNEVWTAGTATITGTEPAPAAGTWSYGSWGACSASCGGGTQTRTATCLVGSTVVSNSRCAGSAATSQSCNPQSCSVSCGAGYARSIATNTCVPLSSATTVGNNIGGHFYGSISSPITNLNDTARRLCAGGGLSQLHDFSGWADGKKKPGKGCGDADTDHYAYQFNGDLNDPASVLNTANYSVFWSRTKDTNCHGWMAAALCSGSTWLTPTVNAVAVNTTNAAAATPPAGMVECPAGIDLSGGDPFANTNYFVTAKTGVNGSSGNQTLRAASSYQGGYTPALAKQELNCYQRKVEAVCNGGLDWYAPQPWTGPAMYYDLGEFGSVYLPNSPPCAGDTTTYYSLYTVETALHCKQETTTRATGRTVENCQGTGYEGTEYVTQTTSQGDVCGNDSTPSYSCQPIYPDPCADVFNAPGYCFVDWGAIWF